MCVHECTVLYCFVRGRFSLHWLDTYAQARRWNIPHVAVTRMNLNNIHQKYTNCIRSNAWL